MEIKKKINIFHFERRVIILLYICTLSKSTPFVAPLFHYILQCARTYTHNVDETIIYFARLYVYTPTHACHLINYIAESIFRTL